MRDRKIREIVRRFWDGTGKDGAVLSFDDKGMEEAISRAVVDLTPRTLKKKPGAKGDRDAQIRRELLPRLWDWFERPEADVTAEAFDEWHHKTCEEILKVLQTFYTNRDQEGSAVQYGKAQKIVNMTMKGLYCLEGSDAREKHFEHCHMALDSFTLEWFRRYVADGWYNQPSVKGRAEKIRIAQEGGPIPKWSNLDFRPGSLGMGVADYGNASGNRCFNGKYHYMFFVTMIREYFRDGNLAKRYAGMTQLQGEFLIWSEMQLEQAAENLYGQDLGRELTVAAAREDWARKWQEGKVDRKKLPEQFNWCKSQFKKLSLEEKLTVLSSHMQRLLDAVK